MGSITYITTKNKLDFNRKHGDWKLKQPKQRQHGAWSNRWIRSWLRRGGFQRPWRQAVYRRTPSRSVSLDCFMTVSLFDITAFFFRDGIWGILKNHPKRKIGGRTFRGELFVVQPDILQVRASGAAVVPECHQPWQLRLRKWQLQLWEQLKLLSNHPGVDGLFNCLRQARRPLSGGAKGSWCAL